MLAQIVLFDGFDLLDAIAPYEVLHAAGICSGGALNVELVSAEGACAVTSGIGGLQIAASGMLNPERADIIVIPGAAGSLKDGDENSIPVLLSQAAETGLTELMRDALAHPHTLTVTVCGGSLVLAMGGLLVGRRAVTHHQGMEALGATGAIPIQARVVDDGNLITGGGVTSGLDVALYVVERELGPQIACSVEKLFEYERRGTVWRPQRLAPVNFNASPPDQTVHVPDQVAVKADNLPHVDHASFDGEWNAILHTPIGRKTVTFKIVTENGHLRGTATQGIETVDFIDPIVDDQNRLMWSQSVTKPFPLNLKFNVMVSGDEMTGSAKANKLPATSVTARRIPVYSN